MDIKEVWKRITSHAGELFYTKKGVPYTYHISGQRIVCLLYTSMEIREA